MTTSTASTSTASTSTASPEAASTSSASTSSALPDGMPALPDEMPESTDIRSAILIRGPVRRSEYDSEYDSDASDSEEEKREYRQKLEEEKEQEHAQRLTEYEQKLRELTPEDLELIRFAENKLVGATADSEFFNIKRLIDSYIIIQTENYIIIQAENYKAAQKNNLFNFYRKNLDFLIEDKLMFLDFLKYILKKNEPTTRDNIEHFFDISGYIAWLQEITDNYDKLPSFFLNVPNNRLELACFYDANRFAPNFPKIFTKYSEMFVFKDYDYFYKNFIDNFPIFNFLKLIKDSDQLLRGFYKTAVRKYEKFSELALAIDNEYRQYFYNLYIFIKSYEINTFNRIGDFINIFNGLIPRDYNSIMNGIIHSIYNSLYRDNIYSIFSKNRIKRMKVVQLNDIKYLPIYAIIKFFLGAKLYNIFIIHLAVGNYPGDYYIQYMFQKYKKMLFEIIDIPNDITRDNLFNYLLENINHILHYDNKKSIVKDIIDFLIHFKNNITLYYLINIVNTAYSLYYYILESINLDSNIDIYIKLLNIRNANIIPIFKEFFGIEMENKNIVNANINYLKYIYLSYSNFNSITDQIINNDDFIKSLFIYGYKNVLLNINILESEIAKLLDFSEFMSPINFQDAFDTVNREWDSANSFEQLFNTINGYYDNKKRIIMMSRHFLNGKCADFISTNAFLVHWTNFHFPRLNIINIIFDEGRISFPSEYLYLLIYIYLIIKISPSDGSNYIDLYTYVPPSNEYWHIAYSINDTMLIS